MPRIEGNGPQRPSGITTGLDGAFWYTDTTNNSIGRITLDGVSQRFGVPTANSQPLGIAHGFDNNLWFTESNASKIGRITPTGEITEFDVPSGFNPTYITNGPDGNMWFTELDGNRIGRITLQGVITEFPVPTIGSQPFAISGGSNGDVWFTELATNRIGRISTDGSAISGFVIPTPDSQPAGITVAPDGTIWFSESRGNKIGRIDRSGMVIEFTVPTAMSEPTAITVAADGIVWFVQNDANAIGSIDGSGNFGAVVPIPTAGSDPQGITAGVHSLWFTSFASSRIGVVQTGLDANQSFVQSLYADALGRLGSDEEIDFWVNAVLIPRGSGAVVEGIEKSLEGRGRLVRSWYAQFLARTPDGTEERGWVNQLAGRSEEAVLAQILGSLEFRVRANGLISQGTQDERFVSALYSELLRRPASNNDVQGWVQLLPQLGYAGVAKAILGSTEYRLQVVRGYYRDLLDRANPPSSGEENSWVLSSLTSYEIRFGFETSTEYFFLGGG